MNSAFQIQTIVSMPFGENTYVVWRPERRDALVFDPGLDPDAILSFLEERDRRGGDPQHAWPRRSHRRQRSGRHAIRSPR